MVRGILLKRKGEAVDWENRIHKGQRETGVRRGEIFDGQNTRNARGGGGLKQFSCGGIEGTRENCVVKETGVYEGRCENGNQRNLTR